MNKLIKLMFGSTLTLIGACAFASGNVVLDNQNHTQERRLENLSTLSQLVTHPALSQDIWWAGAVIASPAATRQAESDKRTLLARLAACQAEASPKQAVMLQSVIDQLQNIKVAGRLFTPLDPDAVRSLDGADVPLQGEYKLYTRSRPSTLQVLGAISAPGPVMWQPATRVSHYLETQNRLSGADNSTVTIIHPDGRTTVAPVAYWNNLHREAEPGSIVWVGFTPCATGAAGKSLQDDIISLLTRRVPD
jgi:hypothetical protein